MPARTLRLSAEELRTRLEAGEAIILLDARGERQCHATPWQIPGAVRWSPGKVAIPDPGWSREQLIVIY